MAYSISKTQLAGAMPVGCLLSGAGTARRSYKMEVDGHG
jgi:hypothetical protein